MTNANQTVTRKLGANRGAIRLWLEGAVLTSAGFPHGARWSVEVRSMGLMISLDRNGTRKIAGTIARPIIDINSTKLLQTLGKTGDTVEIFNKSPGLIYVTKVTA